MFHTPPHKVTRSIGCIPAADIQKWDRAYAEAYGEACAIDAQTKRSIDELIDNARMAAKWHVSQRGFTLIPPTPEQLACPSPDDPDDERARTIHRLTLENIKLSQEKYRDVTASYQREVHAEMRVRTAQLEIENQRKQLEDLTRQLQDTASQLTTQRQISANWKSALDDVRGSLAMMHESFRKICDRGFFARLFNVQPIIK